MNDWNSGRRHCPSKPRPVLPEHELAQRKIPSPVSESDLVCQLLTCRKYAVHDGLAGMLCAFEDGRRLPSVQYDASMRAKPMCGDFPTT